MREGRKGESNRSTQQRRRRRNPKTQLNFLQPPPAPPPKTKTQILTARGLNKKSSKGKGGPTTGEENKTGFELPPGISAAAAARLGGGGGDGDGGVGGPAARRGGADIFSSVIERIERQYCFAGSSSDEEEVDEDDVEDEDGGNSSGGSDDDDDDEGSDGGGEKRTSGEGGGKRTSGEGGEKPAAAAPKPPSAPARRSNRGYQGDHYEYDDGFLDDTELGLFHGDDGDEGEGGGGGGAAGGGGAGAAGSRKRKFGGFYICQGRVERAGEEEEEAEGDRQLGEDGTEGGGGRHRTTASGSAPALSLAAAAAAAAAGAAASGAGPSGGANDGRAVTPSSPRPAGALSEDLDDDRDGRDGSPSGGPKRKSPSPGGGKKKSAPVAAAAAEFVPPPGVLQAVADLRAATELCPLPREGAQRKIPDSLKHLIVRLTFQADRDIGQSKQGRDWLHRSAMAFLEPFSTRGNFTARLRVDREQAVVEAKMRAHRLREGPAVSLSTSAAEGGAGPLSPASASAAWPGAVDRGVNAFVEHWLLVHGGSREGAGGREAAAEAAGLLRLGTSPAAIDAVLAAAERGAAREAAEHAGGGGGGGGGGGAGRGGSASRDGGGGGNGGRSKAKSPTPPPAKEKTPPPPCPITEQIIASAIAAGADPKRIQESLEAFPGATAKAVVNKTLLYLGRRGATVGEVLSTANALGLTGEPKWDESSKGKRTHVSTMLSSGGKLTRDEGDARGGGASGDGGVGGQEAGKKGDAALPHFSPFFVHVGQRKIAHVYAHSAYPGLVSAAEQAKVAAASAAAAVGAAAAAAAANAAGGNPYRPPSSSRGVTPTPTPTPAAVGSSKDAGGGGGSVSGFAAQLQSVAAVLADKNSTTLEKAAALGEVPVAVIEALGQMNPAFRPLLEALAKVGGSGGGGGSAAKDGGSSGGKGKGKK